MKIIRDDDGCIVPMMPLFYDWGVRRCNVKGCRNRPTTIIQGIAPNMPLIGMCEEHFQAANKPEGGVRYVFEFDGFDAFAPVDEDKGAAEEGGKHDE